MLVFIYVFDLMRAYMMKLKKQKIKNKTKKKKCA